MTGPHGHVTPRADGARARCGGPSICAECSREHATFHAFEIAYAESLAALGRDRRDKYRLD